MICEVCIKGNITTISSQGVDISKCDNCGGFWIQKGDLNKLIKHKSGDIEFSSIDRHFHTDNHGIIKCVFCEDSAMRKVSFLGYSDIILDYCEDCGAFWVDSGEINKMQDTIDTIEKDNLKKPIIQIIMEIFYSLPRV